MPDPRVTIDDLPEQLEPLDSDLFIVQDSGVSKKMSVAVLKTVEPSAVTAHIADPLGAHAATAISAADSGNGINGVNVQAQLGQLSTLASDTAETLASRDVMWVGTEAPTDPVVEVWYDPDEPAPDLGVLLAYVDVREFGAVGDGTTDDMAAVYAAVTAAAGGTLFFPAGTYKLAPSTTSLLAPPAAGTKLVGENPATTTILLAPTTSVYRAGVVIDADDVTFENLTVRVGSEYDSVMFQFNDGAERTTLRNCVFDGGNNLYPSGYSHCLSMPAAGTVTGIRVEGCTFTNFGYPWIQTNASTATVTDIAFVGCDILNYGNAGLGFNAPVGVNRDILIDGCRFVSTTGRSAVSLAHCENAIVTDCQFQAPDEAVHIEDYTNNCVISGNTFYRCGETGGASGSAVVIVYDSSNLLIDNNTFDNPNLLANTNKVVIYLLGEVTGNTVGGRVRLGATYGIRVSRNVITAGPNTAIIVNQVGRVAIEDNTLRGGLAISSGFVESGTQTRWGVLFYASTTSFQATIARNTITGFLYGIAPQAFNVASYQHGTSINSNTISECRYGIVGNNTRSTGYTGNIVFRCIHPMVVRVTGMSGSGPGHDPYSLCGNVFYGNQRIASINGKMVIVATGTASIGTGVTLAVEALVGDIHNTRVINFAGGGVFTMNVSTASGSTAITGNLTTANIAVGAAGLCSTNLPDRPYEAPFTVDNRGVAANADSVAATYT